MDNTIIPDAEEFGGVAVMPKAKDASDAEKYRLAQAVKKMRLSRSSTRNRARSIF